jgi:hypothetical protein
MSPRTLPADAQKHISIRLSIFVKYLIKIIQFTYSVEPTIVNFREVNSIINHKYEWVNYEDSDART